MATHAPPDESTMPARSGFALRPSPVSGELPGQRDPGLPSAVGVVGLGLVGSALAGRLANQGIPVIGFDLRPEARARLATDPRITVVDALADLASRVSTALLAVFDTDDVLQVLAADEGLLVAGSRIDAVIDCSTGDPARLAALAADLVDRGIDFIEAPLSGSSLQIAAGEATMLLGGRHEAIARQQAMLDVLCLRRIHVGEAGFGARAKLATNLVLGLNRAVLAEGMVFAQTLGIAPQVFLDLVLATPARSAAAETKGAMMVSGRFDNPQSRIHQHLKDVRLMLAQASASGQSLPLSASHATLMDAAVQAGDGDLDNAGLIRQWRRLAAPSPVQPASPANRTGTQDPGSPT